MVSATSDSNKNKKFDEHLKKLSNEFLQIEEQFVKKGLTGDQVSSELLQHIRDQKTLKKLQKQRTSWRKNLIFISISVVVALVAVGVWQFREDIVERYYDQCWFESNVIVAEVSRPLQNCAMCESMKEVPIVRNIDQDTFLEKYAFTGAPVLIKDATGNWTAMQTFNYDYFKEVYSEKEDAFEVTENDCQFFGYETEFNTLEDAMNMDPERAAYKPGEKPWYFGWSNCHQEIAKELRKHYNRPYFLPEGSESSDVDWIFMGGPGPGAFVHLDYVHRPSWQAQISGKKTWTLIPAPECDHVCHQINVTVEKGDIFVIDTNQWFHATHIHPGELSITIGSEYE